MKTKLHSHVPESSTLIAGALVLLLFPLCISGIRYFRKNRKPITHLMKTTHALPFLVLSLLTFTANAAMVSFSEGEWAAGSWTIGYQTADSRAYSDAQQILSDGNPGAFLKVHNYAIGDITTFVFLTGKTYDPAGSGAIMSLDGRFDRVDILRGQYTALALRQGNKNYLAAYDMTYPGYNYDPYHLNSPPYPWDTTSSSWSGLTAGSFHATDSSGSHPDFSASGSAIMLGFADFNIGLEPADTLEGIDNLQFSITFAPIPEPSTIIAGALLLLPLGVTGARCLRRTGAA